ncbi:MAG: MupA/Atu3671 family FMN-dependent luciferase-like monooxygenase [Cyanobacteria bacterium P01_G01_bin.19]
MYSLENEGLNNSTDNLNLFSTLVDLLHYRAQERPDRQAYIFLQDGETESGMITYGELERQARAIATQLQSYRGERALLLYPSGLEFITAFFGCLYAGIIAVPVYPPRRNQKLSRLLAIANDAQAKLALTTSSILPDVEKRWSLEPGLAQLKLLAIDTIEADSTEFLPPTINPESLAFLQYTSGSTGIPKGVMVNHGNIIHNQQSIHQAFGHGEQSIVVGWLPLFHDMGLIGNVLQPLYGGFTSILMPPVAFLMKPIRWLKAIAKYRATTSGGPNFAYDLCVKKIKSEQLTELDLSSWDLAFNGAEPIRAETLKQFTNKFTSCGFNHNAFYPCYGMAETTLFTTGGNKAQKPVIRGVKAADLEQNLVVETDIFQSGSRTIVGCGRPYADTKVIIVNPNSLTRCQPDQVGEICVGSESVAAGYWNRPQATQKTFQNSLKGTDETPFLRTGDLGFFSEGELFVTGRLKDLIILRGRNYYPQDIELSVEKSHPALRANCGAAFTVEVESEERLVVVQEVERTYVRRLNLDEVVEAINQAISIEHELAIDTIVLLKPGSIPKTSSGKIQRRACKQKFLDRSLPNVVSTKSLNKLPTKSQAIEFSLLYFSSNQAEFTDNKYQLLLEGARFADQNNFHAVWLPERHFDPFGGLYPEPAVLGSALAMITEKIRLRSGSVVLPLQNPVRVAEQWSVVDNLSGGRVDISFATGWNPNDFILAPENYANRTQVMFDGIKTVQKLWRGESVYLPNGKAEETEIRIYPLPKQPELPIWITCSGGKERFIEAGAMGANILTALLFQPIEELAEKIALYRESRAKNGYDPKTGRITLMLHTFVGSEMELVRNQVQEPFTQYLESSVNLWKDASKNLDELTLVQREKLLAYAFERYFQTAALFGTPSSCLKMVNQLKEIGVNEVACLIDFGVDIDSALSNLSYLNQLRKLANDINDEQASEETQQQTIKPIKDNPFLSKNIISDLDSLQNLIKNKLANKLKIDANSIKSHANFVSYGLDSVMAVELIQDLEDYFNQPLEVTLLWDYPTIASLAQHLAPSIKKNQLLGRENDELIHKNELQKEQFKLNNKPLLTDAKNSNNFKNKQKNVRPWLTIEHTRPEAKLRLFCLPYAGGRASAYKGWSEYLPSNIEVCVIDVLQTYEHLTDLFEALIPMLLPYLDKPFAFYGHSLGALIAFELSRCLRKSYQLHPSYLFVAAQHAPQLAFPYPSFADFNSPEAITLLKSLIPIEFSKSRLQKKQLTKRLFHSLKPGIVIQNENYTYEVDNPLDCPIFAFGGVDDPILTQEYLKAWQEQTLQEFQLKMLSGGHLFLHECKTELLREMSLIIKDRIKENHYQ